MRIVGMMVGAAMVLASSAALAYPPPQSAEDQHCRGVAQSRIFSEPNPEGLSLYDHGYRIWAKCMRQVGGRTPSSRKRTVQAGSTVN